MDKEVFEFTPKAKKRILVLGLVGLILVFIGIIAMTMGGHGQEAAVGQETEGHVFHWIQRLYADLWINNMYFIGLAIIGVFFFAIQYASQAGWSAAILRIPLSFGNWLPYALVLFFIVFLVSNFTGSHLFHWLDHSLYIKYLPDGAPNPEYDPVMAGKQLFLNVGFYVIRAVVILGVWLLFFLFMKKEAFAEDVTGNRSHWKKLITASAIFIIFFALSSSIAAWDWIMSIDPHWFSTMMGWYVFASWFVSGLAAVALLIVILNENGYLQMIKPDHFHNMGLFVFAFSIFWAYLWYSQFMLIYYGNIPEEAIYFAERLTNDLYSPVFYLNIILNFFFPFLVLMTRDSKRHGTFLKIVCTVVLFGHWLDFYLMVTPGTLQSHGGFGFMEVGTILVYLSAFLFVVLNGLTKAALVPKNHPMMQESLHHHI